MVASHLSLISTTILVVLIFPDISIAIETSDTSLGTPTGTSVGASSRPQSSCPNTALQLIAVNENNHNDGTYQEQPTFLFYIPYDSGDISIMDFTLLDEHGRREIYETQIALIDSAGIIQLDMSDGSNISLRPNTLYQWNFKIYCQGNSSYEPDRIVNGWIKRVDELDNSPLEWQDQYQFYRENNLWYDAISIVADYYTQEQENLELQAAWIELLESLNYPELVNQPFVEFEKIEIE